MYRKLFLFMLLLAVPFTISQAQDDLAPEGKMGEIYFAPFPVQINLDGDLSDWTGVPKVSLPLGITPTEGSPGLTFAAAADGEFLYLMGDVMDDNVITGQHDTAYWNEDSIEFYINATGDLLLENYEAGVAQITVPPINATLSPEETVISGVQGDTVDAQVRVTMTDTGYAVEVALPLKNDVWAITPAHGSIIGFQAHLNAASTSDRDSKLIWSIFDLVDASYQNPSLFGYLAFYEVGQTDVPPVEQAITALTTPPEADPLFVGTNAPYKNPHLPIDERVDDLLARMTIEEKVGQMTLVEKGSIQNPDIAERAIGGLLSGGGGSPRENTPEGWAEMVNDFQDYALQSRLAIPLIYGVDAVHGHNNVRGATIFPHNIGLGAANDPALVEAVCHATAEEMVATGIYWNYSPVVAVTQDPRWGRYYEGYGENTELVTALGLACMEGLQGEDLSLPTTVLATPKHYIGDGATVFGTSTTNDYAIDQGVMEADEATLREIYLPPYQAAVESGALSIMVSFSSWQDTKMHAESYLINDILKGELGFEGFVVSDWGGVDQISPDYYDSVVASINAGVDMNMVPYDYNRFIGVMLEAVANGDISEARIDDAVRRILTVKFALGLFEWPYAQDNMLPTVGSEEHRQLAREAVAKSLVLLKNENDALPLTDDAPVVFIAGEGANDIGMQSGGWTISWQGEVGDITPGTTILEAVQATVSADTQVFYDRIGRFLQAKDADGNPLKADVGIVVIGEKPYAEGVGDSADLALEPIDLNVLERVRERSDKVIVVLLTGRPVMINEHLEAADAFVVAWLPGTEGQGVADVLFGDVPFTGQLPVTWMRSLDQLPLDPTDDEANPPLFPYGYGLK